MVLTESWPTRDLNAHRATYQKLKKCKTPNESGILESQTGVRYSVLTDLLYFDPIRFTVLIQCTIYFWVQLND